ncbi:hypothetical protein GCM10009085_37220 [Pseudomonas avellanae]|nr:hypothetical protein GCM10009085_37220 [Pseudomonas avellanae]
MGKCKCVGTTFKTARRASRTAFLRWSVRNDHPNYRATLRGMAFEKPLSCDAPRRHAVLDAPRPLTAATSCEAGLKSVPRECLMYRMHLF